MDYLNNINVWTNISWSFDIKTFYFNANISSLGNYNGFKYIIDNERYYYNVFPPKLNNIYCNGQQLNYDKLYYLKNKIGINNIDQLYGNYYYDPSTMSLNINCFKIKNIYNNTNILIH